MKRWNMILVMVLLLALVGIGFALTRAALAQSGGQMATETPPTGNTLPGGFAPTDPQTLMIPRWFLGSLTLNGEEVELPAGQEITPTVQFAEGGKANGKGTCNDWFADYTAGSDGSLTFGSVGATKMFCESHMQVETAFFEALGQVRHFETGQGDVRLTSEDGKTVIVLVRPPK